MSSNHEFSIDVASAEVFSPEDADDLRSTLETATGAAILRAVVTAWTKETGERKLDIEGADGKRITDALKFRELELFKERIGEVMTLDDDHKLVIRLDDDSLTSNRSQELYALLVYLGLQVRGWESDSEFSWKLANGATIAYFWEGDGVVFPEGDYTPE